MSGLYWLEICMCCIWQWMIVSVCVSVLYLFVWITVRIWISLNITQTKVLIKHMCLQITAEALRGVGSLGDIALDDFNLLDGDCPRKYPPRSWIHHGLAHLFIHPTLPKEELLNVFKKIMSGIRYFMFCTDVVVCFHCFCYFGFTLFVYSVLWKKLSERERKVKSGHVPCLPGEVFTWFLKQCKSARYENMVLCCLVSAVQNEIFQNSPLNVTCQTLWNIWELKKILS